MGRSPCCEKTGLKRGPWTPEEDQKLLDYIKQHGHGSWRALPAKAGLQRCGKSCRLRWTNYLRPDIKRGQFTLQEEQTIIQLHALLGNRWSAIATHLPKRTDNEIKNYWNTHLKKRLAKMGIDPVTHKPKMDTLCSMDGHTKDAAHLSHMAQWESARLEAEARLVRESRLKLAAQQRSHISCSSTSHHLNLTSAPPSSVPAPAQAPAACLDMIKAWQGIWSKNSALLHGAHLESPKALPIPVVGFGENSKGSTVEFIDGRMGSNEGYWSSLEEPRRSGAQAVGFAFIDRFTDLLVENFNNGQSVEGHRGGDEWDEGDVEGKNYWNNILNLVNASSSDSPLFALGS